MGRIADFDTRLLTLAVIGGALQGRTEEQVNFVNAPSIAEERGIVVEEKSVTEAQDFNELIRVTVLAGGERVAVAGTGIGRARAAPGRGAGQAPDDRARPLCDGLPLRGPAGHDRPGGDDLRRARHQHLLGGGRACAGGGEGRPDRRLAAMVVTTDAAVATMRSCRRSSPPTALSTDGRWISADRVGSRAGCAQL